MTTASPRRLTNQCEMSAIIGPKPVPAPIPISTWAAVNTAEVRRIAGENETRRPKSTAEMTRGRTMPKRSVIRPSAIVEKASAHIISV